MESPSESAAEAQLDAELQHAVLGSFSFRIDRPELKHLNADSSWLLSLPYPRHISPPSGRCRFNILIDAWLRGSQVDVFSHFSSQKHATPSRFQTVAEIDDSLRQAETRALQTSNHASHQDQVNTNDCYIDAVFCSHEFTDHCHEATLREVPPSVPIYAPKKAAGLIRSWKHFDTVTDVPVLEATGLASLTSQAPLPEWIEVGRIHTRGDAPIYFHSALVIAFSLIPGEASEAIVYTPHGVAAESVHVLGTLEPRVKVLALLHGLHDVSLMGAQLNMGMDNALKTQHLLDAKYWFPTHDEVKLAQGLVALFLRRVAHTFQIAPGSHPITQPEDSPEIHVYEKSFHELANGESFILQ